MSPSSRDASHKGTARRRNFDDRAQTETALRLRAHTTSEPQAQPSAPHGLLKSQYIEIWKSKAVMNWTETSSIARALNSAPFLGTFGAPAAIELSPTHILVGTQLGRVALFDYRQNLAVVLVPGNPDASVETAVTCIAVSPNGVFACAGHACGSISVWEIPRGGAKNPALAMSPPLYVISSVSMHDRARSSAVSGHLAGVPVVSVGFVGDSQVNVVSADIAGLVLFHHGSHRLFRRRFYSERLLGSHVASPDTVSDRFAVHECQVLPAGTAPHLTDHIGVVAAITCNVMVVVSICSLNNDTASYPKTHFKITRSKSVAVEDGAAPLGCLAWYPSITGTKIAALGSGPAAPRNARLAYSWNNVLTMLELDNAAIPDNAMAILADLKDKDRAIPKLAFLRTARWTAAPTQKVVSLKWLNSEILTALIRKSESPNTNLHFFYYRSDAKSCVFEEVGQDSVDSMQAAHFQFPGGAASCEQSLYNSSLRIFRHRPVILVNSDAPCGKSLFTGTTSKWADRLVALIKDQDFSSALLCAFDFYCSKNDGQLLLSGLPHTTKERHSVVAPFLLDIMRESIQPIFEATREYIDVKSGIWLYLHLVSTISADSPETTSDLLEILDSVYEMACDQAFFFETLEQFILSGKIRTLPPSVFKSLVETYAEADRGDALTEIICILDSATLNIDLTLKLCEVHGLRECFVYIWTSLLKDYKRPFARLIADIDRLPGNAESTLHTNGVPALDFDQKCLVFTYMSYVLTGRRFPTDEYMDSAEEESARTAICSILFASRESDDETFRDAHINLFAGSAFPYLHKFMKFNVFETLATLNEFFENPCLNTEARGALNRQYIVEALLDTAREHEEDFSAADRVQIAIFVARNYPKFVQFIRISDSVLTTTVETLCDCPREIHNDAELALESLLPVYDVKNVDFFLQQLKAAKFYRVAFGLNRSMQRFSNALEIWLEQQSDENAVDLHTNFGAFADIVANTFTHRGVAQTEQLRLLHIIEENFDRLISEYARDMVILANSYSASVHQFALQCKSETNAWNYLTILFKETENPNFGTGKMALLVRLILLSCNLSKTEVCTLVDFYSTELLRAPQKVELLRQGLEENDRFDAVAILSRNQGNLKRSISEVQKGLVVAVDKKDWTQTEMLIKIGVSVCERDKEHWQSLVHTLVSLNSPRASDESQRSEYGVKKDSKENEESVASKKPDGVTESSISDEPAPQKLDGPLENLLNEGIYTCFRNIIDRGEKEQRPEFFTDILQSVMDQATLSHVREVLQETLTSFYFDSEIHNITLSKLNVRVLKDMETLKMDSLQGWILKEKACASCGKAMWGEAIHGRHMEAWERREKARVFHQAFDESEFKDVELVVFKCRHAYHAQCLERLASVGRCVICTQ